MFKMLKSRRAAPETRIEPVVIDHAPVKPSGGPQNIASSASMEQWQEFYGLNGVSAVNAESAMKLTAVFGCVSLLAGTLGTLPVRVVQKDPSKGSEVKTDHPAHYLVHMDPHPMFSAEVFYEGLFALAFLEGNAYAEIQRNGRGDAIGLRPLWDAYVLPFKKGGRIIYSITEDGRDTYGLDQDDVLHFAASATMRGVRALSPIKCFAKSIGIGLNADDYAEKFFSQGINPNGYISFDGVLKDEQQADEIRNYWARKHGGVSKSHLPAVLTNGGKFTSLLTDPETAQLFQSRSFQVLDIARAYGVPPHLIGETDKSSSWGTGIAAQTTQFYILGLRKHVKRFEAELSRKMLSKAERLDGFSIKFNLDSLLRADVTARFEANKAAVGGTQHPAWETVNEIRKREGLAKSDDPNADVLYRPVSKVGAVEPANGKGEGGVAALLDPQFKHKRSE